MTIRWTFEAANDLEEIWNYLAEHRPSLAQSTMKALYETAASLRDMPYLGHSGGVAGTRELIAARIPYVISYQVGDHAVEILKVRHTSRDR